MKHTKKNTNDKLRRGAHSSVALLFMHMGVCVLVAAAAFAFSRLGLRFAPCAFYRLTGYTCPSCGATRSVLAMMGFRFGRAFLYNPFPPLTVLLMLGTLGFEFVGTIRKTNVRFKHGWVCALVIFGVTIIYNLLRILGVAPLPNAV